jgi:DeoR family transcriptional regulator of aga operon
MERKRSSISKLSSQSDWGTDPLVNREKRKKPTQPAENLEVVQSREKQQQRVNTILISLQETSSVTVDELAEQLRVSVVTIRRDLDLLEQQGLLRRTHGGAVSIEPLFYEPFKKDRSFVAQVERQANEKRRIGRAAAALITAGETIAITPGTTTAEIIRGLPLNSKITVVTNTANIAMELSKRKDISVFVTGGHLHGDWFSLVGPTAIRSLDNMLIHTMFVGADGIDPEWGLSCFSSDEAELNATMVRHARRHIAVVDHTKLNVVANWRICETSTLKTLITDTGATDEMIAPYQKLGIEVLRV